MSARLLIIDDNVSICNVLRYLLILEGYYVDCANTLEEAQDFLTSNTYDCMLTDLHFGNFLNCDGLAVVRIANNQQILPKIILMSSCLDATNAQKARSLGVTVFLEKPFECKLLFQIIKNQICQCATKDFET